MNRIRVALLRLATQESQVRGAIIPLTKQAEAWSKLPAGWTQDSVESFWSTLTGENKHKVTKCIKEMEGKFDDPGAFCASLADKVDPGWRSRGKTAFNKENAPELMGQLLAVLQKADLKDAANQIKQKGIPALVDKAWAGRGREKQAAYGDPFWMIAKYPGKAEDGTPVKRGDRVFYYPRAKVMLVGPKAEAAAREVRSLIDDENFYNDFYNRAAQEKVAAEVAEFVNAKTKMLADGIYRDLAGLKNSFDKAPNLPSNVGGFIRELFGALGNRAAFDRLHLMFGNNPQVGNGFGLEREISSLARPVSNKVNEAEAAALGVLLLRKVKRPSAATGFEAWANQTLNLVLHDPRESGSVKPLSAGGVFEATITPEIMALAAESWGKIGKTPDAAETLAYEVAEDLNWHSLQGVGPQPGVELPDGLIYHLGVELYGLEDAAAFIVALLRLAGKKRAAEVVKRQAMQEFSDAYGTLARIAQEKVAFNKENAPELMGQLLAVLSKADLKDTVNQIKQKGIPALVDKAWAGRDK